MASFEKDLFISYAHIDNRPLTPEQDGWISRFHESLNALLSMRMGKQARIWRDDKLQGNDVFADEIVAQFGRTAVLISVLTPRYLQSEWCTREVSEFCALAEASGGVVVDKKARVFKILKTPVDTEEPLPSIMQDMLGYEFFAIEDGTPLELDAAYGEKFAQDYNRKVGKLAFEIAQLLQSLDELPVDAVPQAGEVDSARIADAQDAAGAMNGMADGGPGHSAETESASHSGTDDVHRTIYLAECSFDLKEARETLQTELMRLGYDILPDRQLPRDEDEYVDAVSALLGHCGLSIHLVGAHCGAVADGPRHASVVALQNELAAARSTTDGLRRVIWQPAGTVGETPTQQAFIANLHEDADAQAGADLIVDDIEALKRAVLATLVSIEPSDEDEDHRTSDAAGSAGEGPPTIYMVCTEGDRKATIPIRKFFRANGCDVTLPAFEGDAAEVRAANHRMLSRCDAILVYYGQGEEAWKRTIDTELKKLPIHRDGRHLPPVYTVLGQPSSGDKEDLIDMEEPNLIDTRDSADDRVLAKQLSKVLQVVAEESQPA